MTEDDAGAARSPSQTTAPDKLSRSDPSRRSCRPAKGSRGPISPEVCPDYASDPDYWHKRQLREEREEQERGMAASIRHLKRTDDELRAAVENLSKKVQDLEERTEERLDLLSDLHRQIEKKPTGGIEV